jgi:DNA-binding transcriptional LysR family regulator
VINRDRLLERLSHNEDDLYVMGVPPEDLDIESKAFMDNPLVVLAPASHPMVARNNIPFTELANETFLVRERGSGTRMTMERVFQERNTPLRIKMELGSNEAIKQAVAGGLGLALLSRSTLNLDQGQKELAVLDVQGFPIMRAWYVVRPKGKQLSVVAQTFLEFLHSHVELLEPPQ